MKVRAVILVLALAGSCLGQSETTPSAQLSRKLHEAYRYTPPSPAAAPKAVEPDPPQDDDAVVKLEPFTVTAFTTFEKDLAEAARRAAAAREAEKFSPLTGGLILAKQFGRVELKLGLWPELVPVEAEFPPRHAPKLLVDVIRINW